jgi:small-conductance mechanosensitive channel
VIDRLREIGAEMRAGPKFGSLILGDLEVFGLDAFADSALVIKGRIKTRPIKQWGVGREFNRRVAVRFAEFGTEIPFPHTTVYFRDRQERICASRAYTLALGPHHVNRKAAHQSRANLEL